MAIETIKDAEEYLKSARQHLNLLRKLSQEAGFHTHAAMWLTIEAAFLESGEEIQTVAKILNMYLDDRMKRYDIELFGEVNPKWKFSNPKNHIKWKDIEQ